MNNFPRPTCTPKINKIDFLGGFMICVNCAEITHLTSTNIHVLLLGFL